MKNTKNKQLQPVSFRIPSSLRELIKQYLQMDGHISESEFFRDALRTKIENDAPELYRTLFKKGLSEDD